MGRVSPNIQIDNSNPLEDHYNVALAQGGPSSERFKPSASNRVQELINRYNLNNLKLNLHSKDHS